MHTMWGERDGIGIGRARVPEGIVSALEQVVLREAVVVYRGRGKKLRHTVSVTAPQTAATVLRGILPEGPQERFVVLALDARNIPIGWTTIAVGEKAECSVDTSAVFRFALLSCADRIMLCHNHPSGDPSPSVEDETLTRRIIQGAELLGVSVLDHIIPGDSRRHFGFADAGLL